MSFLFTAWVGAGAQSRQIDCSMDCAPFAAGDQYRTGSMRVRVGVRRNPAQGGRLQWVLENYPTGDQIQVGDSGLKQRILESIESIRAVDPICGFGPNNDCRFNERVEERLADARITLIVPDILEQSPEEEDQGLSCTLCFIYPAVQEPPPEYQLVIAVKTVAAARESRYQAHRLSDADVTGGAGAVPVMLAFAEADLENARTDTSIKSAAQAERRVTGELLKVANRAFQIAAKHKLLSSSGKLLALPGSGDFRTGAEETSYELRALFDLQQASDVSWGNFDIIVGPCCERGPESPSGPCANLCIGAKEPVLILMVAGVQILRSVRIRVMPDTLDLQFAGTETGRALEKKREDSERSLNRLLQNKLSARPGYLATAEDVRCDRGKLCRPSLACSDPLPETCTTTRSLERISSMPRIVPDQISAGNFTTDANLVYEVLRRLPADREITLSAGGDYSPEEKLTGKFALGELNMLGLAERASLAVAGGPEVRKLSLEMARPFDDRKGKSGFRVKEAGISIKYFRDDNRLFGNRTGDPIGESETGSSARLSFDYDSFNLLDYFPETCESFTKRKRTHWTLSGVVALDYRDVDIAESDALLTITGLREGLLPSARSQVSTLSLDTTAGISRDFRRQQGAGLGQAALSIDAKLSHGLSLFGSDYVFGKALLAAHSEVLFGTFSPQDFFLRYSFGVARATGTTPVFELFRLGGPQNIRGMEEGEYIGRRLSFQQSEFGINALTVWHLLGGSRPDDLCATPCSPQSGGGGLASRKPVDLSNLYVKAFFDQGRISDPSSFETQAAGSFPPGAGAGSLLLLDRRARGFGLAVELRNLPGGGGAQRINLSLGYARSSQSGLHPSGVLFTGVSIVLY